MTDKELLELAARAAGIEGSWGCEGYIERHEGFIPTDWRRAWSPLIDDADTFRLAVALNLFNHPLFAHFLALERFANQDQDDCTAHRRAFTRAAAAIGKEMGDE